MTCIACLNNFVLSLIALDVILTIVVLVTVILAAVIIVTVILTAVIVISAILAAIIVVAITIVAVSVVAVAIIRLVGIVLISAVIRFVVIVVSVIRFSGFFLYRYHDRLCSCRAGAVCYRIHDFVLAGFCGLYIGRYLDLVCQIIVFRIGSGDACFRIKRISYRQCNVFCTVNDRSLIERGNAFFHNNLKGYFQSLICHFDRLCADLCRIISADLHIAKRDVQRLSVIERSGDHHTRGI